ncbi:MAG: hypothetical protein JSW72_09865 [Candidatus Bathyarchaeota archaeon]|nr:MAG: hypothetical protein JSW72_09865 [Candidatus Bathyarchaeota archaeon]
MGFLDRFRKPKAQVMLTIPKPTVYLGDDLKGAITISSNDEFDATEIRGELRCVEKRRKEKWIYDEEKKREVRRVYWDIATLHSANPKVAEQMHLISGVKKTFPLQVNIPIAGRESFDGIDGNVSWLIKGVIAIDGRPDVTSKSIELQVIKSAQPIAKKDDVTMVACEYCQGLMPETTTACPNCRAPRKA